MVIVTVEIEYVPPKAIFPSYICCSVELWLFVKQHLLVVDATDRQGLLRMALSLKVEVTFIILNVNENVNVFENVNDESALSQLSTL